MPSLPPHCSFCAYMRETLGAVAHQGLPPSRTLISTHLFRFFFFFGNWKSVMRWTLDYFVDHSVAVSLLCIYDLLISLVHCFLKSCLNWSWISHLYSESTFIRSNSRDFLTTSGQAIRDQHYSCLLGSKIFVVREKLLGALIHTSLPLHVSNGGTAWVNLSQCIKFDSVSGRTKQKFASENQSSDISSTSSSKMKSQTNSLVICPCVCLPQQLFRSHWCLNRLWKLSSCIKRAVFAFILRRTFRSWTRNVAVILASRMCTFFPQSQMISLFSDEWILKIIFSRTNTCKPYVTCQFEDSFFLFPVIFMDKNE